MMKTITKAGIAALMTFSMGALEALAQAPAFWHGKERKVHYQPSNGDFLLVNGTQRFNRALYGTNTPFRVEAGDLPEFSLYMPGLGGTMKLALITAGQSKWLTECSSIQTIYRPGAMVYKIKDPLLGEAVLQLDVLASSEGEGMLVRAQVSGGSGLPDLLVVFGGASGQKFSRDGDIGADPESSFNLTAANSTGNLYNLKKNTFKLNFRSRSTGYELNGVLPSGAKLKLSDATQINNPAAAWSSLPGASNVLSGRIIMKAGKAVFISVSNAASHGAHSYNKLHSLFEKSERTRMALAQRVQVETPDPYINTLGAALAVAADAIWQEPSYLHGAVAWRMRIPGWRGAYAADQLGWHDRAKTHFQAYSRSQVLSPASGPVEPDSARHWARQVERMGNAVFSSGYISRNPDDNTKPHHYDMNLVYIDQLLTHFQWTGDLQLAKELWPVITKHLAWEKRNFDADGDGLYDAYSAIWASDALQYSGGAVTHSSAYNYRANLLAAKLAALIGENPQPYKQEADKIYKAINTSLWLPAKGTFAEFKDALGNKMLHPAPGLWSVYHAIDSRVGSPQQLYLSTKYVDNEIPHIPIKAQGLQESDLYTLSTTNWQPYTWSLNNVALAELLHTSLAFWQAGRSDAAFKLWKSSLVESMFLGASPGNFQQLSFYDAQRGELYRDFADPVGMAARSLVEGLFGIRPDALADTLNISPGFPEAWNSASIKLPELGVEYQRSGLTDTYRINSSFKKHMKLHLVVPARSVAIKSVKVNGQQVNWKFDQDAVGSPKLLIDYGSEKQYEVEVQWEGILPDKPQLTETIQGAAFGASFGLATITAFADPQQMLAGVRVVEGKRLNADRILKSGKGTVFVKLKQRDFSWWMPLDLEVKPDLEILYTQQSGGGLRFSVRSNEGITKRGFVRVNPGVKDYFVPIEISKGEQREYTVPEQYVLSGTNVVRVEYRHGDVAEARIINWNARNTGAYYQKVNLQSFFNDKVSSVFKNKYLSPRPAVASTQLPWQGIGNWCYPLVEANIDDSGLRRMAFARGEITLPNGVPMQTVGVALKNNVIFTSLWDNYPDSVTVPLTGRASHAYLMMAGSTNPMQSRLDNAMLLVKYTDGSTEKLPLRNPGNWWPIEQDYYVDGYAFDTEVPMPFRVYLKSGMVGRNSTNYTIIKGFTSRAIDGGAATILDMPLNPRKELQSLTLRTLANDVVVGLMSLTLQR